MTSTKPPFRLPGSAAEVPSTVDNSSSQRRVPSVGLAAATALAHLDSSPDAMLTVDHEGVINWGNRSAADLFGYSLEEFVGSPMSVLVPERLRADHDRYHHGYLESLHPRFMGASPRCLLGLRRDDTEFAAEISLGPVGTGPDVSVLAVVRDVDDLRAREAVGEAIRMSLDSVGEAVFMFEVGSYDLRYVNEAACKQTGRSRDELVDGNSFLDLSANLDRRTLDDALAPLLSGDRSAVTFDLRMSRAASSDRDVEVLIQRHLDSRFGPDHLIALVRDTTERDRLRLMEDRDRIGRELQDNVVQRMFAAGMSLQAAGSDPDRLEAAAADVITEIDDCIALIRNTIFNVSSRL